MLVYENDDDDDADDDDDDDDDNDDDDGDVSRQMRVTPCSYEATGIRRLCAWDMHAVAEGDQVEGSSMQFRSMHRSKCKNGR